MTTRGPTKMRIPSASFCQRSDILLSSSCAISEYIEKMGPELAPNLDCPCSGGDGWFDTNCSESWRTSGINIDVCKITKDRLRWRVANLTMGDSQYLYLEDHLETLKLKRPRATWRGCKSWSCHVTSRDFPSTVENNLLLCFYDY